MVALCLTTGVEDVLMEKDRLVRLARLLSPPDPRSPAWALPGVGSIGRAGCVLGALVRGRELPSTLASQSQPPCLLEVSPVRGWPCLAQG